MIDLLEVARTDAADRILGRAFDAVAAGDLLARWILEVLGPSGGDGVTLGRRPEGAVGRTLPSQIEEET